MFPVTDRPTIPELLAQAAQKRAHATYLRYGDVTLTYGELAAAVDRAAQDLWALGVRPGRKVAVMLPNSLNAVYAFFALIRLGAVQIPVNVNLQGEPLDFLLGHSQPDHIVAHRNFAPVLAAVAHTSSGDKVLWCDDDTTIGDRAQPVKLPDVSAQPDGVVSIMYTSGTTGPPKGVKVTDKMHRACAYSSAVVADVRDGDCLYLWEPIYHITGTEVLILALMHNVSVGMTTRFSASRFWREVKQYQATHIHYVGGILQILLRQPETTEELNNSVRVAWGGGAPSALWQAVSERFDLVIRENYGMTETSSLTTFNTDGKHGSVGKPAPYFDVGIFDAEGQPAPTLARGEIWVKDKGANLVTPGYYENDDATARAFCGDWFRTGDVGYLDEEGYLYYAGRLKDSVRRRGENISGWEIERVVDQLEWVEESALIGVTDELGDEELKLCVKTAIGHTGDAAALFAHCDAKLPRFQVPRYICFVDGFDKTDTQRIRKETLSRDVTDSFTRSKDGELIAPTQ